MPMSPVRRKIQALLEQERNPDVLLQGLGEILKEQGVPIRRGWLESRLRPALTGVLERSLGDPYVEALGLCESLSVDLGVDLLGKGLLAGDQRMVSRVRAGLRGPG